MNNNFLQKPEQHSSFYREEDLNVLGGSPPGSRLRFIFRPTRAKKDMFRPSRPRLDIVWPTRLKLSIIRRCSTYVSTRPDLFFGFARPMFWISRPNSGMLWLCSIFVSTVLELCFDCVGHIFRIDKKRVCFDFLDQNRVFRVLRPMF